ncbi:class III lanthionine synthetase LanKC [Microbacterium sp. UBA1097]|uniref:class III lanthionine synthetase LanKC n=1 Tax=Microbacterium sp. UBA1097 TaxID=1946941 RepID=UPI0025ECC760|nr:class III lanthionine synthetase LanKC [Microbacterium sp. UBA1097]
MEAIYHRFARIDLRFYDDPGRAPVAAVERYALPPDLDWAGWASREDGTWHAWYPPEGSLPEQGWKIHASARLEVANDVLEQVARYCHAERIAFKHLVHRGVHFAMNSKDADRSASGKFITVYPRDVTELRRTLAELDAAIGGMPGPYVLSDLRWRHGPLSVRYGAFVHQVITSEHGFEVTALRDPDGLLVEDVRSPGFTPPAWVELPDFLQEQFDALGGDAPPAGFPRVLGALHHSNAGGVYDAEDAATGARIVIKEGRPDSGMTPDGRDAVQRLTHEEITLRSLTDVPVSRVHGSFTLHGHRFLLLERIAGESLQSAIVPRHPLVHARSTPTEYAEYRQWALEVTAGVDAAVTRLHGAGFSHGDVHPGNVMIGADGSVTLLDLEMAAPVDDAVAPVIGAPAFMATDGRRGADADRYGLACIKVFVFYPLTSLFMLDPFKSDDLVRAAMETFALDDTWAAAVHRDLALTRIRVAAADCTQDDPVARWDVHDARAVRELQELIADDLTASADFSRDDRVWPGDPQQFAEDGTGLAHGVAGVVYALSLVGREPDERGLAWIDAVWERPGDPRRPHRAGLWDGLAGLAWLHRRLGRRAHAQAALERLRRLDFSSLGSDLYGGLPGVGLVLLEASDDDPTLVLEALEIGGILRSRHDARQPIPTAPEDRRVATGSGGLLRGPSGTALFALRLYERTGEPAHLRLAQDALDYDLAHCMTAVDGSLQLNEGWRLLPYLGSGSAGVGLVAAQLLPHLETPDRYLESLDGIRSAALTDFVMESGVFRGRAGMILFLAALERLGYSTPEAGDALRHHVADLRLHAIRRPHGIGFPGQGLLRLSCDFATGSAGVLAALGTSADLIDSGEPVVPVNLPLLVPPTAASPLRPPVAWDPAGRG